MEPGGSAGGQPGKRRPKPPSARLRRLDGGPGFPRKRTARKNVLRGLTEFMFLANGGGRKLEDLLRAAAAAGASDVYLAVGAPPALRVDGRI